MMNNISMLYCSLKNLFTVFWLYLCIENSKRLNSHQRSHLTKAMTATAFYSNRNFNSRYRFPLIYICIYICISLTVCNLCSKFYINIFTIFREFTHFLINFSRTTSKTSRSGTD